MGIKELSIALKEDLGPYVENPQPPEWSQELGALLRLLPDGFFDDSFYLDPEQHKDIIATAVQIWPQLTECL